MKQAVVIVHGMGEQIPMQTLKSFVDAVWTTDLSLTTDWKADPKTDGKRSENASWAKPDKRNNSFELRRITTEESSEGKRTDFYEYYWAHLMHGTTWDHVRIWLTDLLWRLPSTVPRRVMPAWILLWLIVLVAVGITVYGMLPKGQQTPSVLVSVAMGIGSLIVAAFVSNVLIKRFGDVARYVKALPPNVARRQEIRQNGVELLERLIVSGQYDRIIVVAHSLGTIVAYDILSVLFARHNKTLAEAASEKMLQPQRHKLEEMIRHAGRIKIAADPDAVGSGTPLNIDKFQDQQAAAFAEARAQGASWIISDFVTLGAPLTHAEFLMSDGQEDLRIQQTKRILPTCPPMLEYDGTTELNHFTYVSGTNKSKDPKHRRVPHHAALFAYTRWTNLYSKDWALLTGDLISGPVAEGFGAKIGKTVVKGIRDISVLPALTPQGKRDKTHRRTLFSHNNYWNPKKGSDLCEKLVPHHIDELRKALQLVPKQKKT